MNQPLLCEQCRAGPHGVEGHTLLTLHVHHHAGQQRATFDCTACGSEWSRTYTGSGGFTWMLARAP